MDILSVISSARLVPVVVLDDAKDADPLAQALVDGGLPLAEVTFRTAAAQDSIRAMARRGDMIVGAGTILTGGEYNVTRGLRRAFGLRGAIITALADNEVGRLVEELILTGGLDTQFIRWLTHDGVGQNGRNGLNFTDRGFGVRGAVGVSDRGHTAASQLRPGDIDWDHLFGKLGVRWLHTGGIFAVLSESTTETTQRFGQPPASFWEAGWPVGQPRGQRECCSSSPSPLRLALPVAISGAGLPSNSLHGVRGSDGQSDASGCRSAIGRAAEAGAVSRSSSGCVQGRPGSPTATREELRLAIVTWIERTYHRSRRHRRPGRLTWPGPVEKLADQQNPRAHNQQHTCESTNP